MDQGQIEQMMQAFGHHMVASISNLTKSLADQMTSHQEKMFAQMKPPAQTEQINTMRQATYNPRIKKFDGTRPDLVEEWLQVARRELDTAAFAPNEGMRFLYGRMAGLARAHFEANYDELVNGSWDHFCTQMRNRFIPESFAFAQQQRLVELKVTTSVQAFIIVFQRLAAQFKEEEIPEKQKVFLFINGLRTRKQLFEHLVQKKPTLLKEAIEITSNFDGKRFLSTKKFEKKFTGGDEQGSYTPMELDHIRKTSKQRNKTSCKYCKKRNHKEKDCWFKSGKYMKPNNLEKEESPLKEETEE
ncbi:hypothetical protein NEOLI_004817 [Neolecta irregularis DAH-3]|uniref:Retrotransposon gag domain-containing protein n=1 Tax=Neolecta irregularis (strain DAH-3) TaxID=1198029 RepID=A0A1U7LQC2_NEOID|nr:hypothetical protein NEOLI_004817 [Neolecta irregularis DAH-3]|eukprot:OLL24783.1 hypothetical protein NEOLI_004817 [Neolecta irregularis DAH-3]